MKKIYKLQKELQNLQTQKKQYPSLENISIINFIKYKKILSKEIVLKEQIEKLHEICNNAKNTYEISTQYWIHNPLINCRKYAKLKKKAEYKKDKILYKYGFLNKRPIIPIFQGVYSKSSFIFQQLNSQIQKYNFFKHICFKIHNFTSNIFPTKVNNLAVCTLKKCISGYRVAQKDLEFFKRYIYLNNPSVKYLKSIKEEAIRQLDNNNPHSDFLNSLKPENFSKTSILSPYSIPANSFMLHNSPVKEHSRS